MSSFQAPPSRRTYRLALAGLLALLGWTLASVHLGRAIEWAQAGAPAAVSAGSPARPALPPGTGWVAAFLGLTLAGAAWLARPAAPRHRGRHPGTDPAQHWQRWRHVTDDLPVALSYFDLVERCRFANHAARSRLGLSEGEALTGTLRSMVGADEHDRHAAHWAAVKAGRRVDYETTDPLSGHRLAVQLIPDLDPCGAVQGFCVRTHDASDARTLLAAQAEGERHLKSIADNVPALITYVNTDSVVTFANATFKAWLGSDPDRMVGRPLVELIGETMYAQRRGFLARGFAGEQFSFELRSMTAGGERDLHTTYIPDFRPDGTVAGIFVLVTDVTPMRTVERQLQQLARIDTLTQVANRRHFDEKLLEALARVRRQGDALALMFMDIDHFKAINDTHGHATGDAVLVEFASRLKSCLRETDTVARLGGDEFVILSEGSGGAAEVAQVAERLRARLQPPMVVEGREFRVTSSIGIALADPTLDTPAALMSRADEALYSAKRAGRDRYALLERPAR